MAPRLSFAVIEQCALPANPITAILVALLLSVLFALSGCIRESDITLEQRAHQLAGELMCPMCDGQTIDGSNAQIAIDMRLKVRDLLDEGSTNAEVKDYFVLRYGQDILAAPERSGFSLLAWIVPVFIVLGGVVIALLSIKSMRRSGLEAQSAGGTSPVVKQKQTDLSDYLAHVDRDLSVGSAIKSDESNKSGDAPSSEKAKS